MFSAPLTSAAPSLDDMMRSINASLGARSRYSCAVISWDDVSRDVLTNGTMSCWGENISDTRLVARDGRPLFTVRTPNLNEHLGVVGARDLAVVAHNAAGDLEPMLLSSLLQNIGKHGAYAGLDPSLNLFDEALDSKISLRLQTTFLPLAPNQQALEFAPEVRNYQTRSPSDPRNLLLLCTTQGVFVQQSDVDFTRLYAHAPYGASSGASRHWFEAERSTHVVGGEQRESNQEREDAFSRNKATGSVIGTRGMGVRFNVLMTIQIPLAQLAPPRVTTGASSQRFRSLSGSHQAAIPAQVISTRPGISNAARVSLGTKHDDWRGLGVRTPRRHATEHITATIVTYNTTAGGVPSAEDVLAATQDLDAIYAGCASQGELAGGALSFMKTPAGVGEVRNALMFPN
jgi:huntingtin